MVIDKEASAKLSTYIQVEQQHPHKNSVLAMLYLLELLDYQSIYYVEGYVTFSTTNASRFYPHAWLTLRDKIIDVTYYKEPACHDTLGELPQKIRYFEGMKYTVNQVELYLDRFGLLPMTNPQNENLHKAAQQAYQTVGMRAITSTQAAFLQKSDFAAGHFALG